MKRFASLALLFILSLRLIAQPDSVVNRIITIGQTDNQTMQLLDELCNRIGGRLVGSNAYDNAVKWAVNKFEQWGIDAVIEEVGVLPVGFNRGPWFGRMLSHDGMVLHFATPSYTAGTKGVQRGHVVLEPKTRKEFERMKAKLKGAWVLISGENDGWPIDFTSDGDAQRARIIEKNAEIEAKNDSIRRLNWQNRDRKELQKELLPLIEEPALFYREMVEAGILGIIQSSKLPIRVLYDRKNIEKMSWDNLPKVPDIKLNEHQYATIKKMVEERQYVVLEFDIRNHFRPGPVPFHNVYGVIKGTEKPNELVIMGGHLDAFDVATGASDNGSGVVPAMEAARLIMKAGGKPKRTILVALWAGEEFGLLGSTFWVTKYSKLLPSVSAMFNRDGGPTVPVNISVPKAMMADFQSICEPLANLNPKYPFKVIEATPRPKPTRAGGTDTAPFIMAGVPAFQFGTSDADGYDFNYNEIWHTERDTYEKCPAEYMNHTSIVTAVVVYGVANLDHLLSREGMFAPQEPDTNQQKSQPSKKKK